MTGGPFAVLDVVADVDVDVVEVVVAVVFLDDGQFPRSRRRRCVYKDTTATTSTSRTTWPRIRSAGPLSLTLSPLRGERGSDPDLSPSPADVP